MSLSMMSPILASDIVEIKEFKALKVFLLRGHDGNDLVIKTDAVGDNQIKSANVAVKAIDKAVKMVIITPKERRELEEYCKYLLEIDEYYESLWIKSKQINSQKEAVKSLQESLKFGFPFAKMPKQTIHHLEEAIETRSSGNKDIVRLFVSTLKGDGGLEMLGKVVAGDLFNGNTDRFYPGSRNQHKFGSFTIDAKVTVNPGNAMIIATSSGGFSATMLDYVDPNSNYRDINQSLGDQKQWPGWTLVDKKLRRKFAEDIVYDLEAFLHPKRSFFSLKTKLGRNSVSRLESGMVEGARLLKQRLELKYSGKWTLGTTERYNLLRTVA